MVVKMTNKREDCWKRYMVLAEELKDGKVNRFNFWRLLIKDLRNYSKEYMRWSNDILKDGKFPIIGTEKRFSSRGVNKLDRDEGKLLFLLKNLYVTVNYSFFLYSVNNFRDRKVQDAAYKIIAKDFIERGKVFLKDYKRENSKFLKDYKERYRMKYYKTIPSSFESRCWRYRIKNKHVYGQYGQFYLDPFIKEVERSLKYRSEVKGLWGKLNAIEDERKSVSSEIKKIRGGYGYNNSHLLP